MRVDGYPVHFSFDGDPSEVVKFIPRGKHLLQDCIKSGIPSRHVMLAEGAEIKVTWTGTLGKLYIKAGRCPPFVSGLVDFRAHVAIPGGSKLALSRLYPRQVTTTSSTYGPWRDDPLLENNFKAPSDALDMNSLKPGMFTGEMRKVVQVLIGQGKGIYYRPLHAWSHGIHTDPIGRKWVIEISAGNGVLAWPLPVCKQKPETLSAAHKELVQTLGYYPVSVKLASVGAATSVRKLAPASSLAAFYTGSGMFPECGWAFNANGSAAINVSIAYDGGAKILTGSKYRITFGHDSHSNPNSADITLIESGLVYGYRRSHIHIPDYASQITVSYDWLTYPVNPLPSTWKGPMYCFYNDAGEEITVYSTYLAQSITGDNLDTSGVFPMTSNSPAPDKAGLHEQKTGQHISAQPYPSVTSTGSRQCLGGSVDIYESMNVNVVTEFNPITRVFNMPGAQTGVGYLSRADYTKLTNANYDNDECVIIPFWEREAIIRWRRERVWTNDSMYTSYIQNFWSETTGVGLYVGSFSPWDASNTAYVVTYVGETGVHHPLSQESSSLVGWAIGQTWELGNVHTGPYYDPTMITCANSAYHAIQSPFDQATAGSGTATAPNPYQISFEYQYVTSSGVYSLPPPSYDFTIFNDPATPNRHFMELVTDAFGSGYFASPDMDAVEGNRLYVHGISNYPITDLMNSNNSRLFVGKP